VVFLRLADDFLATVVSQTLRSSQPAPDPTPAEPESQPEPPRRGRRRAVPRFKGFDDDDDDPPVIIASIPESMAVDSTSVEPESQGLFVSQDPDFNMDREPSQPPESQTRTTRKRKTTPIFEDDEEDAWETLAPAAARLKKRRLEENEARRRRGESTPPPPEPPKPKAPATPPKQPKKTKKEKEAELLEQARLRREKAEEEFAKEEQEKEALNIDDLDLAEMQSLAIIEIVGLRKSSAPRRQSRADESDRWDDKWNGRKNFKKFRRRGAPAINARDLGRVIVPLEEVKHKAAGVGDEYLGEEDLRIGKSKKSQSRSQRSGRVAVILEEDGEDVDLPPLDQIQSKSKTVVLSSDNEEEEEEPVKKVGRGKKLQDKTMEKGNVRPAKRAAEKTLTKPAPVKKARQTTLGRKRDESEDSEDELKFRFRRRG
jgi:nibrin